MARLAESIAERNGWVDEWGQDARLLVLTHGFSLAMREREADDHQRRRPCIGAGSAGQCARVRLMGLEGRYSTLRRRLFELRHNNRILQWRITALEIEAAGMRSRLDQFLLDRERLEQARSPSGEPHGAVPLESTEPTPGRPRLGCAPLGCAVRLGASEPRRGALRPLGLLAAAAPTEIARGRASR